MVCPKCAALIDDNCESCYSCGMEFKHALSDENKLPLTEELKQPKKESANKKKLAKINDKRKRIILISISVIIVLATILVVILSLSKKSGEAIAFKMSKKIGQDIVKVEKSAGIHVNTSSVCPSINKPADFDYIYESKKKITVDGVKVPKWTITLYATDSDITKIYYRDYTSQKKHYKGVKLKKNVEIDDLKECNRLKDIQKEIDIDPVAITFFADKTKEYRYMFYYIDKDKNEQRAEYFVTINSKNIVTDIKQTDFLIEYNNIK